MSAWPISVIDAISREERGTRVVSVPRTSRPLCAVCHQEHCSHSDLEYAGIVPVRERVA